MNGVIKQYKDLLIQRRYSKNTQDIYCSYFKDFCIYFRKENKLPEVLSRNEVKKILGVSNNIKHNFILMLIYSAGLRRSELLNLRSTDSDSARMSIHINSAKGKKDRISLLSDKPLQLLRQYYKEYLFKEQKGGRYSPTSVEKNLKKEVGKAGIRKVVIPHRLRRSLVTHLLGQGTNLRYIQELLANVHPKTTEIYT